MRRPLNILTDIEGTTTPIAFVRDVLFPYARTRLPELLRLHADRADVAVELSAIARIAPDREPFVAISEWMRKDAKIAPLKTLQGIVWEEGYRNGTLVGSLYPDVAPALRRWQANGIRLHVYSSGSVAAQRLLFGHSTAGDLTALFDGFYDTGVGSKHDEQSYRAIGGADAAGWLFLSDAASELAAAAKAGMAVRQIVRAEDGTPVSPLHESAPDFDDVEALWKV